MKVLLQELRKSRGLSQNDLARLTRMSPQNIQKIEQGEAKSMTFKTLERFCKALDCQPGDLLIFENETDDPPQSLSEQSSSSQKLQQINKTDDRSSPRLEKIHSFPLTASEIPESA